MANREAPPLLPSQMGGRYTVVAAVSKDKASAEEQVLVTIALAERVTHSCLAKKSCSTGAGVTVLM